jgi:hypothetical protein
MSIFCKCFIVKAPGLTLKYYTNLKKLARDQALLVILPLLFLPSIPTLIFAVTGGA